MNRETAFFSSARVFFQSILQLFFLHMIYVNYIRWHFWITVQKREKWNFIAEKLFQLFHAFAFCCTRNLLADMAIKKFSFVWILINGVSVFQLFFSRALTGWKCKNIFISRSDPLLRLIQISSRFQINRDEIKWE